MSLLLNEQDGREKKTLFSSFLALLSDVLCPLCLHELWSIIDYK